MKKLDFYIIDNDYLEYLQKYGDKKVPNHDYKNTKFYVGIVLNIAKYKYFAPVSSFKIQQKTNYLIEIYDKKLKSMKISSSVRCCFMIPIDETLIQRFCINSYNKVQDRGLIRKELEWCRKHANDIERLAEKVYKWGTNEHSYQYKNCCDFKKLELAYNNYEKYKLTGIDKNES